MMTAAPQSKREAVVRDLEVKGIQISPEHDLVYRYSRHDGSNLAWLGKTSAKEKLMGFTEPYHGRAWNVAACAPQPHYADANYALADLESLIKHNFTKEWVIEVGQAGLELLMGGW